jgi:hypothetical protein
MFFSLLVPQSYLQNLYNFLNDEIPSHTSDIFFVAEENPQENRVWESIRKWEMKRVEGKQELKEYECDPRGNRLAAVSAYGEFDEARRWGSRE